MFKKRIRLSTAADIALAKQEFEADLLSANLSQSVASILREQVCVTLDQLERQLASSVARTIAANRVFEGDGYRVSIDVVTPSQSLLQKMKSALGF